MLWVLILEIIAICTGKLARTHGIGWTQPALDRHRTCPVGIPFQSICVPFQSILGPHRDYVPVVKVVPTRIETYANGLKWYANGASTASV